MLPVPFTHAPVAVQGDPRDVEPQADVQLSVENDAPPSKVTPDGAPGQVAACSSAAGQQNSKLKQCVRRLTATV
jgi:hypothetical protein